MFIKKHLKNSLCWQQKKMKHKYKIGKLFKFKKGAYDARFPQNSIFVVVDYTFVLPKGYRIHVYCLANKKRHIFSESSWFCNDLVQVRKTQIKTE